MRKSLASAFRIARSIGSAIFFALIQNQYPRPPVHDHPDIAIPLPPAVSILFAHILSSPKEGPQA